MSDLSLDELFAQARAAHKAERTEEFKRSRGRPKKVVEEPIEPLGLYANADNWVEGRGIALIHRESRLLLGNFREMTHKYVKDARRLVRCTEAISVSCVEEVDFGLAHEQELPPISNRLVTQRIVQGPVTLATPAVSVLSCLVCVHYYDQGTAKVVLSEPATFASADEVVQLPAGVDLLPALSLETKRALRWQA